MLLLSLTCMRMPQDDVVRAVLRGDLSHAISIGRVRLERGGGDDASRADLGQVVGRALLAAGHDEQAEELFQRQLRGYENLSRSHVRWLSSLDRGALMLHMNMPGRAAEFFNLLADDATAPVALRIEALAGLASALQWVGEYRRAMRTLSHASALAHAHACPGTSDVLQGLSLEVACLRVLRRFDECATAGGRERVSMDLFAEVTPQAFERVCESLAEVPIAAQRMAFLGALADQRMDHAALGAPLLDGLRWLRERRITACEDASRVEAALALIDRGGHARAAEILASLITDEACASRHRYSMELKFCMARLHAINGRFHDALRYYREHAGQAMARLRTELRRVPYSRFLEKEELAEHTDAIELKLPMRYRRAYQFLMQHLGEQTLSIRQVAAHIDVTERALQMAFRTHLGMTPAEVIRRRRMEHIRTELQQGGISGNTLDVAARWGLRSRSTLAQNYRAQFGESPATTRGMAD